MELVEVLHMNGGDGETSYAENSVIQRKLIGMTKPSRESAVQTLYSAVFPSQGSSVVGIADLGCSTGPNALLVAHELIATIERIRRESGHHDWSPEFQLFLNDLPGNDFNAIFRGLPSLHQQLREELGPCFGSCFVNGVPGSFYGRLFPTRSLHFVHSSSSLHWLSQVPTGIERSTGKSEESVGKAYSEQFMRDFTTFLKCRANEMVMGGSMVFTLHCRRDDLPPNSDLCFSATWLFINRALTQMASQGLLEEEKLDTFNRPLYAPSLTEIKDGVNNEGSFTITNTHTFEVNNWSSGVDDDDDNNKERDPVKPSLLERRIHYVVTNTRSGMESFLRSHFGEGLSIDEVFRRFETEIRQGLTEELARLKMLTVSLTRKWTKIYIQ